MGSQYISRKDFQAWVELISGELDRTPDYRSSCIRVTGTHSNGVKFSFECTALAVTTKGSFYGRGDEWNAVKLADSGDGFSHFGKGARDSKTWELAAELKALLTGE